MVKVDFRKIPFVVPVRPRRVKDTIGAMSIENATAIITDALQRADGDLHQAAAALGTTVEYLAEGMRRYGIRWDSERMRPISSYIASNPGRSNRNISEDELRAALREADNNVMDAASMLGVSHTRVYKQMALLGISLPSEMPIATEDEVLYALERTEGRRNEAAEFLGISVATLYRLCQQYGIDPVDQGADVSREELLDAIERSGGKRLVAAELLGVSPTTVARLLERYGLPSIREIQKNSETPSRLCTKQELLEALAATNNNLGDTAQYLGVAKTSIPRLLERYGLPTIRELKRIAKDGK